MGKVDTIENVGLVIGFTYGINEIESVLGVIILCINLLTLLLKYVPKIYLKVKCIIQKVKNGDTSTLEKDVEEIIEDLESLKGDIDEQSGK